MDIRTEHHVNVVLVLCLKYCFLQKLRISDQYFEHKPSLGSEMHAASGHFPSHGFTAKSAPSTEGGSAVVLGMTAVTGGAEPPGVGSGPGVDF